MNTIKITYKRSRADYEYLVKHHGNEPNDMTGGWSEGEQLSLLLKNPSLEIAANIYVSAIKHSAVAGFDGNGGSNKGVSPDVNDRRTLAIYARYGFTGYLVSIWGLEE